MQTDFHFYMTYMAARATGFTKADAVRLGAYAHLVDAGSSSYAASDEYYQWSPSTHIKQKKIPRTCWTVMDKTHRTKENGRNPKRVFPWVALHFLPSGVTGEADQYTFDHEGHMNELRRVDHKWYQSKRQLGHKSLDSRTVKRRLRGAASAGRTKWGLKDSLICRPESNTAIAMVDDLDKLFEIFSRCRDPHMDMENAIEQRLANSGNFIQNFKKFQENDVIKNDGGMDWWKFLLALAGARMHILADTYAHQGFSGCRTAAVNDIVPDSFYYTVAGRPYHGDEGLTNNNTKDMRNPIFRPDHQTIMAKGFIPVDMTDVSYFGHGRAGSFPDYPNTYFKYRRPWDGKVIRRNNPKEFATAYARMVEVLRGLKTKISKNVYENERFYPGKINEAFFQQISRYEKKHRCELYHGIIKRSDRITIGDYYDDYDVIKWLNPVLVAYFSVAVLYHYRWLRDHFCDLLGYTGGTYDTFMKQALTPMRKQTETEATVTRKGA